MSYSVFDTRSRNFTFAFFKIGKHDTMISLATAQLDQLLSWALEQSYLHDI